MKKFLLATTGILLILSCYLGFRLYGVYHPHDVARTCTPKCDYSTTMWTGRIDARLAEKTLIFLGLNRRVLVRLRESLMDKLIEDYSDALFDPEFVLLPDAQGRLQPFWSTVRDFGGAEAEAFVAANLERIPGLGG